MAIRSYFEPNSSTVELVVHTYDGRCVVAVYYTSINRNPLTPLLQSVVDLLYNLFLAACAAEIELGHIL